MAPERVLFYSEGWGTGGIEVFICYAVEVLYAHGIQADVFCTHDYSDLLDARLAACSARRFVVFEGHKPSLTKRFLASTREFERVLRSGCYTVVHICTMNGMGLAYAHVARQAGISRRIVHSHNSDFGEGMRALKGMAHRMGRILWGSAASDCVACSKMAGRYLFGRSPFSILGNPVDCAALVYSGIRREEVRSKLDIPSNALAIGFVGRLTASKNPLLLPEILDEIKSRHPQTYLIVVGTGELGEELHGRIRALGLEDSTRFVDATDDMAGHYAAMDVLCAPSMFEGLSLVAIEAQASGLGVAVSEAIPSEALVTDLCLRLPVEASAEKWAFAILEAAEKSVVRKPYARIVNCSRFGFVQFEESLIGLYRFESDGCATAGEPA